MSQSQTLDGQIHVTVDEGVAVVTIDRPHVRNAMNRVMWIRIREVFEAMGRDEERVRAVVLQGAGGTFCAGSDIKEIAGLTTEAAEETFRLVEEALAALEQVPVPVIGALTGVAAGGGCELMLAADMRVAAASARIGMPVARLGITVSPAFVRRLVRAVGVSRAGDMLFSGRLLEAEEAYAWGLVHYLVEDGEAERKAYELARRVAVLSPASLRHSKALLRQVAEGWLGAERSGREEAHRFISSPDQFWEGVAAFLDKREPRFD